MRKPKTVNEQLEQPERLDPSNPRDAKRVQQRLGFTNIRDVNTEKWEHRFLVVSKEFSTPVRIDKQVPGTWDVLAHDSTVIESAEQESLKTFHRVLLRRPRSNVPV